MPKSAPKQPRRLFVCVAGYAIVAFCLAAGAILGNLPEVFRFAANDTIIYRLTDLATRVAVLAAVAWLYLRIRALLEIRWSIIDTDLSPGPPQPDIAINNLVEQQKDIIAAISSIRQRYNSEAIGLFTKLLASSDYQVRVTERAELLGNSAQMRVSTDYAITAAEKQALWQAASPKVADPKNSEKDSIASTAGGDGGGGGGGGGGDGWQGTIPVPVLKVTKGTLLDNLEVTDYSNASLPVLSQQEARGLVLLAVETLFYLTFDKAAEDSDEERQQEAALWSLRRFVSRMGRINAHLTSDDSATQQSTLQQEFLEPIENLLSPMSVARLKKLQKFCCFFAQSYVVVADVPVPTGVRFIVKYAKAVPLYGRTLEDQRRTRLGLAPYKFWIPLNLAFTAESYHFRMDIGEGRFVADQYLVSGPTDEHLGQDEERSLTNEDVRRLTNGGYVRIRHRSGLPYAHLYARGLHKSDPTNLVTVVKFEETPPGALGATTVVAAVSAALVTFLTFVPASNGPSADTSALLFAVPLFAATFVGHSIDRVQRSSLATYCALAVTGATAFLGAVLFGLVPDLFVVKDVSVFDLVTVPNINVGGLATSVVAVGNVIFLRWLLKYKTRRYLSMLQRRNMDKLHQ